MDLSIPHPLIFLREGLSPQPHTHLGLLPAQSRHCHPISCESTQNGRERLALPGAVARIFPSPLCVMSSWEPSCIPRPQITANTPSTFHPDFEKHFRRDWSNSLSTSGMLDPGVLGCWRMPPQVEIWDQYQRWSGFHFLEDLNVHDERKFSGVFSFRWLQNGAGASLTASWRTAKPQAWDS